MLQDADTAQTVAGRPYVVDDPCLRQREEILTNFKVRNGQRVGQALHQARAVHPSAVTGKNLKCASDAGQSRCVHHGVSVPATSTATSVAAAPLPAFRSRARSTMSETDSISPSWRPRSLAATDLPSTR